MQLIYVDESGSTGTDYDNVQQPIFCLAGICVEDNKWHEINNKFEIEKTKIYPEFKENEIHASELFNASGSSIYKKYSWDDNLKALEKIVDLILNLEISIYCTVIDKKQFRKYLSNSFNNSIKIDPYLYAFGSLYYKFNNNLEKAKSYGIIFSDEIQSVTNALETIYPKLKEENKRIIEKSLYLDSRKNNFIQIADICALYFNKYFCLKNEYHNYNEIKKKHCIQMFNKIITKTISISTDTDFSSNEFINRLFE